MNNKGISLIALAIMIIVMIIIAGIALNAGIGSYEQALVAKAKEERNQVAHAVHARFGDSQVNSAISPIIGEYVPSEQDIAKTEEYLINMFRAEGKLATQDELDNKTIQKNIKEFLNSNSGDMEYTRILRHDDIIELGIDSISVESLFLVNYYSADVVGPIQ